MDPRILVAQSGAKPIWNRAFAMRFFDLCGVSSRITIASSPIYDDFGKLRIAGRFPLAFLKIKEFRQPQIVSRDKLL
jgi:hypothetical protein